MTEPLVCRHSPLKFASYVDAHEPESHAGEKAIERLQEYPDDELVRHQREQFHDLYPCEDECSVRLAEFAYRAAATAASKSNQ